MLTDSQRRVWCYWPPREGQGDLSAGWEVERWSGLLPPSNAHGLGLAISLAISKWLLRIGLPVVICLVIQWIFIEHLRKWWWGGQTFLLPFLLCISQSNSRCRGSCWGKPLDFVLRGFSAYHPSRSMEASFQIAACKSKTHSFWHSFIYSITYSFNKLVLQVLHCSGFWGYSGGKICLTSWSFYSSGDR